MGAPKLNRVKLRQPIKAKKADSDPNKDKQVIKQYVQKIHDLVQDETQAKKLAQIISEYINSKKK